MRSNRVEARNALLQAQVAQEKFFLQENRYGTLVEIGATASGTSYKTPNGYFTISLPTQTNTTFTARAAAFGSQANDVDCATFSIDEVGAKTPAGNCWK